MADIPVQDSRKFFVLPQGYEGGGYYTYGTPDEGRSQYAHPRLVSLIGMIASQWCGIDVRQFGVGNISLADGVKHPDHSTHRNGMEVDIRPLRKDGKRLPCSIYDSQYDRAATAKLIELLFSSVYVKKILFNDMSVSHVRMAPRHDDHFHVDLTL
jgi:penicillin-insensitive murein endopeptidase